MLASLFYLFLLAGLLQAAELPAGIKPCKNDNKLNECAQKTAKEAIKNLINGDPKLRLPVFDPLYVEKIELTDSPGRSVSLNLTLEKLNIHGLKNAEFLKSEMDTKKMHINWSFRVNDLKFLSDYEMNGKFLLVPITGKGKATIDIIDPVFNYQFDYKLVDRKGKKYIDIIKSKLTYEPKSIKVNLENLFNGDKTLGKNLNEMLNENWKELNSQLGPGVASALSAVVEQLIRNICKAVPYDRIFLP